MQFRLLGPVEIALGTRTLVPLRRQQRCLLGILLLESGRVVLVDRLRDLLWDGDPPQRVGQALRSHVAHLRALLAQGSGAALESHGGGYLLQVDPELVDAHRFRALVDLAAKTEDLPRRDTLLREALDLWRGPVLQNAADDRLRERICADLDELRVRAQEEWAQTRLALGRHRDLIPRLARLAADHPGRQRLTELHMLTLYADNRAADALDAYARLRAHLADQLGLDPAPALQQLQQRILRGEPVEMAVPPPAEAPPERRPRPAQLPKGLPAFVGRADSLRRLDALLAGAGAEAVTATIAGTAGVGKTVLAVHWAHTAADHFPDGQLYVNLRGFDPARTPLAPADAIRGFLDALDVPVDRVPSDLDAQVGLYRSLLAGKRVLVVLDNARDAEQVRPLLPATPGCLALVTSRSQLPGLVTSEGAQTLTLDLLTDAEADDLLAGRIGAERLDAERAAATDIVAACARLPLALAIVAARAATQPKAPLSALAADLRDGGRVLDVLTTGDSATDVRAVLSWSYGALPPAAARLFRLLDVHPGADLTASAAASLAGVPVPRARSLLDELTRVHLLTEHAADRYSCHDLLRAYAAERNLADDPGGERRAALHRLLDHYLQTAREADRLLNPHRDPMTWPPAGAGVTPEPLADHHRALAWFAAEHAGLVAAVDRAAAAGFDGHAWRLAWSLTTYLDRRARWSDLATVQRVAVAAARRTGDLFGQASAHRALSLVAIRVERPEEAAEHLTRTRELCAQLGDRSGQGHAHLGLALVYERLQHPADALAHSRRALALYEAADDPTGQARALNSVGWYQIMLGEHRDALASCEAALALHERLDNRYGQAATWDSLGLLHHRLGDHARAATCYQRALRLHRDLGDRADEAEVLVRIGDNHQAARAAQAARATWRQALAILDELGHPAAGRLRHKLRQPTP